MKMKLSLVSLMALALSGCLDSGGASVSRGETLITSCPGFTGVSAQHMISVAGLSVRCGPQDVSPITYR